MPSGCGKSTLIGLAAGLLTPDRGRVSRDRDDLAVAFRDPALRRRTARGNVGFALLAGDLPRTLRRERAAAGLVEIGLPLEARDKYPRQLSYSRELCGGKRQRVALARVVSAARPSAL